jgi:hypothetical protein
VHTISGRLIDYSNPNPDNIVIEDIAHHLARENRFNGATEYGYSVAAHSIVVSRYVSEGLELVGLLHDAPEAYLKDLNPELKKILPEYQRLEALFWTVIAQKFNLPLMIPQEVKDVDRKVACWEAQLLQPWPPAWAQKETIPEGFSLPIYNEHWAAQYFLARFNQLTGRD